MDTYHYVNQHANRNGGHEAKLCQYNPVFRFEVALAALSGNETISGIAKRCGVHPIMVCSWRQELADKVAEIADSEEAGPGPGAGNTDLG